MKISSLTFVVASRWRGSLALMSALALTLLVSGCVRGLPSDDPPIHIVPNMDSQPKYKAQSASGYLPGALLTSGGTMRPLVEGTVARGTLKEDSVYYLGLAYDTITVKKSPVPLTLELLKRGQERFEIYCTPCHGRVGDAQSAVVVRNVGMVPPPDFHQDRIRQLSDGDIYRVILNGVRTMPSYRHQVPVQDRWAIVSYLRALQRSQYASVADVPEDLRSSIK